jgi:hypothetical protein
MLKVAALIYLPVAAVLFGVLAMGILAIPGMIRDFEVGAALYYGAGVVSFLLALPVSWLVAQKMLSRREKRLLDAHAGRGR